MGRTELQNQKGEGNGTEYLSGTKPLVRSVLPMISSNIRSSIDKFIGLRGLHGPLLGVTSQMKRLAEFQTHDL